MGRLSILGGGEIVNVPQADLETIIIQEGYNDITLQQSLQTMSYYYQDKWTHHLSLILWNVGRQIWAHQYKAFRPLARHFPPKLKNISVKKGTQLC